MNPKRIEAALLRVEATDFLITAGNFKTPAEMQRAAARMFKIFQKRLTGFPDPSVAKKASSALKRANDRMQSKDTLKDREEAFLQASRALKSLLDAPKLPTSGSNARKLKDLLRVIKTYENHWADDLDTCLFMGVDLSDFLVVGGLISKGRIPQAEAYADHMDTAARDEMPDSVCELFGWEINQYYLR